MKDNTEKENNLDAAQQYIRHSSSWTTNLPDAA